MDCRVEHMVGQTGAQKTAGLYQNSCTTRVPGVTYLPVPRQVLRELDGGGEGRTDDLGWQLRWSVLWCNDPLARGAGLHAIEARILSCTLVDTVQPAGGQSIDWLLHTPRFCLRHLTHACGVFFFFRL